MIDNPNYDGAITTLCGGGRYNGLLELLGGPNNTGIGFALSIERLLLALEDEELDVEDDLIYSLLRWVTKLITMPLNC